jgi:hypothetical protein
MYIGPGWHGSKWMCYAHHRLSLSCHETRKKKKKLERVALERDHLTASGWWRSGSSSGGSGEFLAGKKG